MADLGDALPGKVKVPDAHQLIAAASHAQLVLATGPAPIDTASG